jgi:hypothetical protein
METSAPFRLKYQRTEERKPKPPKPVEQRFVIRLTERGLEMMRKNHRENPGTIVVGASVEGAKVIGPNKVRIGEDIVQVQTTGQNNHWIDPIDDDVTMIVLVYPFLPPRAWQIVGYIFVNESLEPPISPEAFTSFNIKAEGQQYALIQ